MVGFSDPYEVLGLPRGAGKKAVKDAFRQKAMATHPDLNHAPDAAEQYERVRRAAESLLHGTDYHATDQMRRPQPTQSWAPAFDRFSRTSRFSAIFSAACLVGGCIIFVGALRAHNMVFDGYSYHVLEEAERRKNNPTPAQQRIMSLLMEKKDQQAFESGRTSDR